MSREHETVAVSLRRSNFGEKESVGDGGPAASQSRYGDDAKQSKLLANPLVGKG